MLAGDSTQAAGPTTAGIPAGVRGASVHVSQGAARQPSCKPPCRHGWLARAGGGRGDGRTPAPRAGPYGPPAGRVHACVPQLRLHGAGWHVVLGPVMRWQRARGRARETDRGVGGVGRRGDGGAGEGRCMGGSGGGGGREGGDWRAEEGRAGWGGAGGAARSTSGRRRGGRQSRRCDPPPLAGAHAVASGSVEVAGCGAAPHAAPVSWSGERARGE